MKGYRNLRKRALDILDSKLSKNFFYHGVQHTLDVLGVCNQYIKREKIDGYKAKLLRIAVLMHDIGFTISNFDHEIHSVEIAESLLTEYSFSNDDFKVVKGLIMSTRVPQNPRNHLERIICDADLDYLGRGDYYPISNLLLKELKAYSGSITNEEWNRTQIEFLETHKYHTDFARKNRQPQKEKRISELKQRVDTAT